MINRTLLGGAAMCAIAACASQPPPTRSLGSALAATSAAQEAGATRVPPASLHLSLAREQIDQAQRMVDEGMNERAKDLTVRAFNDAKLAQALAHEAKLMEMLAEMKRDTELPESTGEGTQAGSEPTTQNSTKTSDEAPAPSGKAPSDRSGAASDESETAQDSAPPQPRVETPRTERPEEN